MTFKILVHREAAKALRNLDSKTKKRIKENLSILEEDPYQKRSGADIRKLDIAILETFRVILIRENKKSQYTRVSSSYSLV